MMKPEVIDAILALKKDAKFILYDNDLITMLSLINPNYQESFIMFNWMKYPLK